MSYILASTSLHELVYAPKPSRQALPAKSFPPNPSRQKPPAKHLPYGGKKYLILDTEVQLQLQILDHQVLQTLLNDSSQHDAQREPFEKLAAQQNLDGLPLRKQTLGTIQVFLLRLKGTTHTPSTKVPKKWEKAWVIAGLEPPTYAL